MQLRMAGGFGHGDRPGVRRRGRVGAGTHVARADARTVGAATMAGVHAPRRAAGSDYRVAWLRSRVRGNSLMRPFTFRTMRMADAGWQRPSWVAPRQATPHCWR